MEIKGIVERVQKDKTAIIKIRLDLTDENEKALDGIREGIEYTISFGGDDGITRKQSSYIWSLVKELEFLTENPKDAWVAKFMKDLNQPIEMQVKEMDKDLATMFIELILTFAEENNLDVSRKSHYRADIERRISSSIKSETCAICKEDGVVSDIDIIYGACLGITEQDVGYSRICVCSKHYHEAHSEGMEFFKKYHLMIRSNE